MKSQASRINRAKRRRMRLCTVRIRQRYGFSFSGLSRRTLHWLAIYGCTHDMDQYLRMREDKPVRREGLA